MNLEKFKLLDKKQLETTSGGFWQLLALAIPYVLQSVSQAVASYKMISSNSGSVKYQGYESKWDDASTTSKTKSTDSSVKQIVYAY